MKLSPAQQELLDAMRKGVVVHYMDGINAYFFRDDTFRHCTVTARALLRLGLVERRLEDWRGYQLHAKVSAEDK